MRSCYKVFVIAAVRGRNIKTPSIPWNRVNGTVHYSGGKPALYKRHLAVSAAVFAAVGALVPASAYAGTSVGVPHASTATSATASPAGSSSTAPHASASVTGQAAGTLTPVLGVSDLGVKSVYAQANSSTDSGSTITGSSFNFGDGTAPVNVSGTAAAAIAAHTYAKPGTYTVTVTLSDAAGNKATASTSYTTKGTNYTPYGPTRLLDTRHAIGVPTTTPVAAGGTVVLKVAGVGSIPANAQAAVLNLTVTAPTAAGTLTAYPDGETKPGTQNVTFVGGQVVATLAIVKLGPDGSVDLTNNSTGTTHLVADVAGYFTSTAASGYTSLTPARLLDTRYGTGGTKGMVGLGQTVTLNIAGADNGALPASGIKAVALNVTVTATIGAGYITAYPDGTTRPTASNLNFVPGDVRANLVIVPVGADGKIDLYNYSSGTQLIADVAGYFSASGASAYWPIDPQRVLDTRTAGKGPVPGGQTIGLDLASTVHNDGLSLGMTGFVLTTTVTNTVSGGYLTVYPYGVARPVVSTLNFSAGATAGNLSLATAGQDTSVPGGPWKAVAFYDGSAGSLDVIVDMAGFFDTF